MEALVRPYNSECYDCAFYDTPHHSPPECSNRERNEEREDRLLPEPGERCKYKLPVSEAKYYSHERI